MVLIGTPHTGSATRLMLLGAGELGKEIAIEAQRLGIEVIAVDRYAHAPAMQVAHRSHVVSMLDGEALTRLIKAENPHFIVPEIEAIATSALLELENEGYVVTPTAQAVHSTMNRESIRRLAAEQLGLRTSHYSFANTQEEYEAAIQKIGLPCVVKPTMSSSGKGQSIIRYPEGVEAAWEDALAGARGMKGSVIVEEFLDFDYEITLLTVRHRQGTSFCQPIGHLQIQGDYRESWQPHPMPAQVLEQAQQQAKAVTEALGGFGLFGVEFFIKGDEVYFSEISPRPHDTGLVTLISQDLSEFALHLRAILGLPIPHIRQYGPAASAALLVNGDSQNIEYDLRSALELPDTQIRLFGKPELHGERRMGVCLALGHSIDEARAKALQTLSQIQAKMLL
ncbi:formate-dependent phosphoribosylglycinamide formyltransferase [Legionella sp. 16cNR16C]|uniref:formate-dependent phosphoribosylglycinamide formyltransferase n=1 Tax=Legionella sp. 16cNR16C TaxID=2905656 RepID=UPI001E5317EF|nr:formate-dependent phosphoribosylglycinamide formyltransferase [Legionella sp. 16cNR16C]MCE3045567.1 formate-dependent phosphoribosylglycinamide formyltransferase [Legionella sp. 16cNR16C]